MKRYDPLTPPDAAQWNATDESARLAIIEDYHRRARIRVPNMTAHAAIHAAVENQIALGDEIPVQRTVQRLMSEGLDRHDAIHAVGYVLAGHMNEILRGEVDPDEDPNVAYFAQLEALTAEEWRRTR